MRDEASWYSRMSAVTMERIPRGWASLHTVANSTEGITSQLKPSRAAEKFACVNVSPPAAKNRIQRSAVEVERHADQPMSEVQQNYVHSQRSSKRMTGRPPFRLQLRINLVELMVRAMYPQYMRGHSYITGIERSASTDAAIPMLA